MIKNIQSLMDKSKNFAKENGLSVSNYFTTIEFLEGKTDMPIDLNSTNLDPEEKKKDFQLEYVAYKDLANILEENRGAAKKENREFIIDEMHAVLKIYERENNKNKLYEEER